MKFAWKEYQGELQCDTNLTPIVSGLDNKAKKFEVILHWLTHKQQKLLCRSANCGAWAILSSLLLQTRSSVPNHLIFLVHRMCITPNNPQQPSLTYHPPITTSHSRHPAAGCRPKRSFGPGSAPVQLEDIPESPPEDNWDQLEKTQPTHG